MMQQQNNRPVRGNRKKLQRFLPWAIIGAIALIVLGIVVIPYLISKDPSRAPRPLRVSRVNLIIQSNVGGAEVYINGQPKGLTSDTHYQATLLNFAPKTYTVTLKKQGYAERTESVEITGEWASQTVRIDLQPNK